MAYIKEVNDPENFNAHVCLQKASYLPSDKENYITKRFDAFHLVCGERDFFMKVNNFALFSIVDRKDVSIELINGTTIEKVLPFFYGTVLTILLHMHFSFPIHASAVLSKHGLNLFCAPSGTGKSTLAFSLFKKGYPLFSDDKCILKWNGILKKYTSEPSIRAVRLCQDAIDVMDDPEELVEGVPVIEKENKYQFNLDKTMYDRIQLVDRIYIIHKTEDVEKVYIRTLRKEERVQALRSQMHRPGLVIGSDVKQKYLRFTNNVAYLVPMFFVVRPIGIPTEEFISVMERHINLKIRKKNSPKT